MHEASQRYEYTERRIDTEQVLADVCQPTQSRGLVILSHGSGTDRQSTLLRMLTAELAGRGLTAARIDLPYRRRNPKGPPAASRAAGDRDGIRSAITELRELSAGPVIVGGQSYGGRQASMLIADEPELADGLLLTSYPLHPPGKPERLRTEHLSRISVPTVIVHGTSDSFATSSEIREAAGLFGGRTHVVEVRADHGLRPERSGVAEIAADAVERYLLGARPPKLPTAELAREVVYAPDLDGAADPGEIVWTWVPFEEDPTQGKDRPVLVVGRQGRNLLGLMLSSKDYHREDSDWLSVGSGSWDRDRRESFVRLDRVLLVAEHGIRREGAICDREHFDEVAEALRGQYGWR